eukprot:gene5242-5906_t
MATKDHSKKREKMNQKDYLEMLNNSSKNNIEKWFAAMDITDTSTSLKDEKRWQLVTSKEGKEKDGRIKVKRADLLAALNASRPNSKGGKEKDQRIKVKQADLMAVLNASRPDVKSPRVHQEKSASMKRQIFTNGVERTASSEARKRAIFQGQRNGHAEKNSEFEIKRYHSLNEVSEILDKFSSPKGERRKCERRKLKEENPVDLGGIVMDKILSRKHRQANKEVTTEEEDTIKRRMPFFNKSKNYDLMKEQKSLDKRESSASKNRHKKHSTEEIFISLDKKSPHEKENLIRETIPDTLRRSIGNESVSESNLNANAIQSNEEFSKAQDKEAILF